jgi:hypothetical protein
MHLIPDDELENLAAQQGPGSYQAGMLADLRKRRANDEQVYCFQIGEFLVVCPVPTPEEETELQLTYEATKHAHSSRPTSIAEVIAALGGREQIESLCWICNSCSEMVVSDDPIPAPSTCMFCGGAKFKKAG